MILQQTIQEVFDTVEVVDIVSEFVHLKRRGSNFIGLCPFHDEKTPSFTVSPSKGIYKCFGCGRGGNGVNFLMEHEQMSFPEAIRFLADRYNIEVKEDKRNQDTEEARARESLFILTDFVADFYHIYLTESEEGKSIGKSYFKESKILDRTIEKFKLGFAPSSGTDLLDEAGKKQYSIEKLRDAGLLNRYEKDFFRNRIIFPIHNLSGKVVAFAGRTLSSKKTIPKYINSPETEIYHKRKILYGMHQARNIVRKKNQCILVEGYTDVLSLSQEGIENVVATSGTALTTDQVRLIKRYTENILVLYDGDEAGLNAAERGIDLFLEQDLNVSVVILPEKHDPDSYMQEVGKTAFSKLLEEEATDFILFKLQKNQAEAQDNPVLRASLIKDLVKSIALIPDALKQSLYIKQISEKLDLQEEVLTAELSKSREIHRDDKNRKQRREARQAERETGKVINKKRSSVRHKLTELSDEAQEKDIIRILLQFGQQEYVHESLGDTTVGVVLLINIQDVKNAFENELYQSIINLYYEQYNDDSTILDMKYFIQHENDEIRALSIDILSEPYTYSENWVKMWDMPLQTQSMPEKNFIEDMTQAMYQLKLRKVDKLIDENRNKIAMYQKDGNDDDLISQLDVQNKLIQLRKHIADNLGRVLY